MSIFYYFSGMHAYVNTFFFFSFIFHYFGTQFLGEEYSKSLCVPSVTSNFFVFNVRARYALNIAIVIIFWRFISKMCLSRFRTLHSVLHIHLYGEPLALSLFFFYFFFFLKNEFAPNVKSACCYGGSSSDKYKYFAGVSFINTRALFFIYMKIYQKNLPLVC